MMPSPHSTTDQRMTFPTLSGGGVWLAGLGMEKSQLASRDPTYRGGFLDAGRRYNMAFELWWQWRP